MQLKYPGFYYTVNVDEEIRLTDVFWVDPRSRASFEYFGDVVTFDTTYLTNKYDLKCAPFMGVNHHGQSIMLGVGLLADEMTESFVWLFKAFMEAMGKDPTAISTDQSAAIQAAVKEVFPNANYKLCIWHIMKKVPEKLGALAEYLSISYKLKKVVYESLMEDEFEKGWVDMIQMFKLENNDWLSKLYQIRILWVPVYVKKYIFAGMSSTQRSEGINAFFDSFLTNKTTLKEFVLQYEKALDFKWNKEEKVDFEYFNTTPVIKCYYRYEIQLTSVSTREIFLKFQDEVMGTMQCFGLKLLNEVRSNKLYSMVQRQHVFNGVEIREREYEVIFNSVENKVQCICHNFEHRGVLCMHSMFVLNACGVRDIPNSYILPRWTKEYKHSYFTNFRPINIAYSDKNKQVADLSRKLEKLAVDGGETTVGYEIVVNMYYEAMKKIHNIDPLFHGYQSVTREAPSVNLAEDGENFEEWGDTHGSNAPEGLMILSPMKCTRVGRPKGRLMSIVDKMRLKKPRSCSKCKGKGHTKKTCPKADVLNIPIPIFEAINHVTPSSITQDFLSLSQLGSSSAHQQQ